MYRCLWHFDIHVIAYQVRLTIVIYKHICKDVFSYTSNELCKLRNKSKSRVVSSLLPIHQKLRGTQCIEERLPALYLALPWHKLIDCWRFMPIIYNFTQTSHGFRLDAHNEASHGRCGIPYLLIFSFEIPFL
jgi:hypothetical protein